MYVLCAEADIMMAAADDSTTSFILKSLEKRRAVTNKKLWKHEAKCGKPKTCLDLTAGKGLQAENIRRQWPHGAESKENERSAGSSARLHALPIRPVAWASRCLRLPLRLPGK